MIKNFSVLTAITLALIGCGGNGGSSTIENNFVTKNTQAVTVDGIKNLGDSLSVEKVSGKNIKSVRSSYDDTIDESSDENVCSNGGTLVMSGFDDDSSTMILDAKNCKEGTASIDGALSMKESGEDSGEIKITRDLSIKDIDIDIFIKKSSFVIISSNLLKANFDSKINGEKFTADNLAIKIDEDDNQDSSTIVFKTGSMNIANYYFEVVSQVSPFIIKNSVIKSGLLRLKDGANHKIELEAKNNKLSLKIDQNGNGIFEEDETLSDDLTQEDLTFN